MTFLLDENRTAEQLLAELPQSSAALAHFVAGERAMKSDKLEEARRSFGLCAASPHGTWLKDAAKARLEQLGVHESEDTGQARSEAK